MSLDLLILTLSGLALDFSALHSRRHLRISFYLRLHPCFTQAPESSARGSPRPWYMSNVLVFKRKSCLGDLKGLGPDPSPRSLTQI